MKRFRDKEGDTFIRLEILSNGDWLGYWDWMKPETKFALKASYVDMMIDLEDEDNENWIISR